MYLDLFDGDCFRHPVGDRESQKPGSLVSRVPSRDSNMCDFPSLPVSLVTRPGFSKEEPRRAASAGLEGSVKFYHSSGELLFLGGMRGATIVYVNDVMSYFK